MRSDGIILHEPLGKFLCNVCGLAIGANLQPDDLYSRSDGLSRYEHKRNRAIATGVARLIGKYTGSQSGSLLEVGAASFQTTAILAALLDRWEVFGIDSSPEIQADAIAPVTSIVSDYSTYHFNREFDAVFSNNVIEHVVDLVLFLEKMSREVNRNGVVIACTPSYTCVNHELLFTDHKWHFTPQAMASFSTAARLELIDHFVSEWDSGTHVYVLRKSESPLHCMHTRELPVVSELNELRLSYLSSWNSIQKVVRNRINWDRPLLMFGAGEFAQLVRAYLPDVYQSIAGIIVDSSIGCRDFGDVPIFEMSDFAERDIQLIVAVNPRNAKLVISNLMSLGFSDDNLIPITLQ
jgi:2-polyprenyl-3-methyl-5-hydroxy-6-metoxy-1,4-benzoquinol methylase